jgi:hypothetical protein
VAQCNRASAACRRPWPDGTSGRAQLIEGATPKFAKTLSSKYAHLGVGRVKADLLDNHGRSISATYVQRVSDAVGLLLTTKGERWQYALPDDLDRRSVKGASLVRSARLLCCAVPNS